MDLKISMNHRFNNDILKNKGYKQKPDGTWYKPKKGENSTPITPQGCEVPIVSGKGIFIPCNVPSSKNGRDPYIKKEGPPDKWYAILVNNKLYQKYKKDTKGYYSSYVIEFQKMLEGKTMPYTIAFHFVRSSHRKFDYHNVCQAVCDIMQKEGWIPDDDSKTIIPDFSRGFSVDKNNAGVWIDVL
jgi:Holliday junction resolvase RusA-like endonuclease